MENGFLNKIRKIIEDNISNEQFGVSELASEIGMSRSNLLRKIKKLSDQSVSQFIRQVRLEKAEEILREGSITVSEVSFKVGFSSPSYFIKCYREYYGYPPGETAKKDQTVETDSDNGHKHQLAAIMFTDIEGYTALMQQDENQALQFRNKHREAFNRITAQHRGKILQYYGDGTLSTFQSAIDAVRCAIELQGAFRQEPKVPVRIGIHTGDIIFTEDDIIGDGVNVASRIESIARSGGICVSEKVYDEIKNQANIQTRSLGVFELKNVNKPLEVFAITNPGLTIPDAKESQGKAKISKPDTKKNQLKWIWSIAPIAIILVLLFLYFSGYFEYSKQSDFSSDLRTKKSIAVLPFINNSDDSSNVYIVNGLMESTLNNLQKIKDLRVISRTSVEKYRNNLKSISEIARELDVQYIIEGSGQKIGNQIMFTIQLIDAPTDKHLWSEQYTRELEGIFELQQEIAKNIISRIEVFITPEEEERINKPPTENVVAYDYFLKGIELLRSPEEGGRLESIHYFRKAIEHDKHFARAHSAIAIAYYLLDEYKEEKIYSDSINYYADKALFYDEKLPQGLVTKALFYMVSKEYELAIPYLEKALEYSPNSDLVYTFLVDLYANHFPNTAKYLEYALRGLEIDLAAYDSATLSISYLHISNAFIQSGFTDEALLYIDKSLSYLPENIFSQYVKAYIVYAKNQKLDELKNNLLSVLKMDTNRVDVLQETGKVFYYLRDYESSYRYYEKFLYIREAYNLDIYKGENAKIGYVLSKVGKQEESNKLFDDFKVYADQDKSVYKHYQLASYYSFNGDIQKALEHYQQFSQEDNIHYWTILFADKDPLMENLKDLPEFKKINKAIEEKFWNYNKEMKNSLMDKGLL